MSSTYYDILGLAPDASEEAIKTAYRKKAVRYHPDKNPGDKEAEEVFREASKAYETLTDPKKRAIYDESTNFQKPYSKYEKYRKGTDLKVNIKVKIEDMILEKKRVIKTERRGFCPDCEGTGSSEKKLDKCIFCGGTGLQGFALVMGTIKKCTYCLGAGSKPIGKKCNRCKGTAIIPETIQCEIILNPISRVFKLEKLGNCCFKGTPGDLYVELNVERNLYYKIKRLDISTYIKISPAQAILGDTVTLSFFNRKINIKILPGTQNNALIKVDEGGITYRNKTGKFIGIVHIITPTIISDEEKELYEKIFNIEREMPCPKILSV